MNKTFLKGLALYCKRTFDVSWRLLGNLIIPSIWVAHHTVLYRSPSLAWQQRSDETWPAAVWALVSFSLIRVPYDFRKYPSQQTQSFIIHTKHNMGQNTAVFPPTFTLWWNIPIIWNILIFSDFHEIRVLDCIRSQELIWVCKLVSVSTYPSGVRGGCDPDGGYIYSRPGQQRGWMGPFRKLNSDNKLAWTPWHGGHHHALSLVNQASKDFPLVGQVSLNNPL